MSVSSSPPITFRNLKVSDLPAALELWSDLPGMVLSHGDSPEQLERYLVRNPGLSQAALIGEELIGAVLAGHDGRRGLLYHLAVRPSAQGAGVGRPLVNLSLADLKAAGITRVLILVLRDNEVGRSFWDRQGWEEIAQAVPMAIEP
jgi:ribosomal protein S18 acetylase RimI-like enzyme